MFKCTNTVINITVFFMEEGAHEGKMASPVSSVTSPL